MSQSFIKRPDNGPHSALAGLGVLNAEAGLLVGSVIPAAPTACSHQPASLADASNLARYKWLRKVFGAPPSAAQDRAIDALMDACSQPTTPEQFDMAIDAAMAACGTEKKAGE